MDTNAIPYVYDSHSGIVADHAVVIETTGQGWSFRVQMKGGARVLGPFYASHSEAAFAAVSAMDSIDRAAQLAIEAIERKDA